MKNKSGICVVALIIAVVVFGSSRYFQAQSEGSDPGVSISLEKGTYLPGEAVRVALRIDKVGKDNIDDVKVLLAFGDGPFKDYKAPTERRVDHFQSKLPVAADGSIETTLTVLYHQLKPTSHLSELYAQPIREKELNDFWALNAEGVYRIKVVASSPDGKRLESNVLEIEVIEPVGADALIWEAIRGSRAAARMMHSSDDSSDRNERFEDRANVASLIASYPESVYAKRLAEGKE